MLKAADGVVLPAKRENRKERRKEVCEEERNYGVYTPKSLEIWQSKPSDG